jgi:hypothetical protein
LILPPESVNLGDLLYRRTPFRVPKYQRAYAWDEREITDYVNDINKALKMLRMKRAEMHFFGGLVTVFDETPGGNFEIVDGQQRLSTFMITVSLLAQAYSTLSEEAKSKNDQALMDEAISKFETIRDDYMYLKHTIPGQGVQLKLRLELSRADKDFFRQLVSLDVPNPQTNENSRRSHMRLKEAHDYIQANLIKPIIVASNVSIRDRLNHLIDLENALLNYCYLILIKSNDRKEAYKLFAILNDRGKKLHDGDLLRLYTLELLETHTDYQQEIETAWDEILWYEDNEIEGFLQTYFPSHTGKRAPSRDLSDEYLKQFFYEQPVTVDRAKADRIRTRVFDMKEESVVYYQLLEGLWPYGENPRRGWDRDRLKRLVRVLKHTICLPVLLSASRTLSEDHFAQIVSLIELFSFRYITIVGEHAGRLGNVYNTQAKKIRDQGVAYDVNELKKELATLQKDRASDALFAAGIEEKLVYSNPSVRLIIRYMLTTLEDYYKDYDLKKTELKPEKLRVFDLDQTTIEHVYPQNASTANRDALLEPLKHTIGNLSILIPEDNIELGNDPFIVKRNSYLAASLHMNRDLAQNTTWTVQALSDRKAKLVNMALKVFSVV